MRADLREGPLAKAVTPVVLFPAFHFTKLEVTVHNQTVAPGCPRSGAFQDWYQNPHPSKAFSQGSGINHFALPSDASVLTQLIAAAERPRSRCAP